MDAFTYHLSSISSGALEPFDLLDLANSDKLYHMLFYLIFFIVLATESEYYKQVSSKSIKVILVSATVTFTFGALVEILQYTLNNGRKASITDHIANTIGIVAGILLYKWLKQWILSVARPVCTSSNKSLR